MPKSYQLFLKGGVGGWNFSSDMVNYVLDKHKGEEVHVLVNSLGGNAYEGLTISSLFKGHENVHVHYIGPNASAATIAAMGAKRITIDADACFLVHKAMNLVFEWDYMNADELDAKIEEFQHMKENLSTLDGIVAGMYARRCKKTKEELLALMKEDKWLTAQEALEWGFVDEITDSEEDKTPALSEETVTALASASIPLPPNMSVAAVKKDGFLGRLINFVNSLTKSPEAQAEEPEIKPYPRMSALARICAVVGATLAMTDEKLFLTEEQADAIEANLEAQEQKVTELTASATAKDTEIADLKAQVEAKDAEIAQLKAEPADTTTAVVDEKKTVEEDPYAPVADADALAAAEAFLNLRK